MNTRAHWTLTGRVGTVLLVGLFVSCGVDPAAKPSVQAPTCSDGLRNGQESDVDCGSACAVPCAVGKACQASADCASGTCSGGLCLKAQVQPHLDRVEPPSGPIAGGALLRLTGGGFLEGSVVTLDSLMAGNVSVKSDSLILAVAPAHGPGLVDVALVLPDGTSVTALRAFSYFDPATSRSLTATGVTPSTGSIAGGTWAVVHGTGLGDVRQVFFGSVEGTVRRALDESVVVVSPPWVPGSVDVRLVTALGQAAMLANAFTYFAHAPTAPRLDRVSPIRLPAGQQDGAVALFGSGLSPQALAFIDGRPTRVKTATDTRLDLQVGSLPPGTYDVAMTNPDGATALLAQALTFFGDGCDDHLRNGDETDVDCGGRCGATCGTGRACVSEHDCQSAMCPGGSCTVPTCAVQGPKSCAAQAVCADATAGRTCTCAAGYAGDGFTCSDRDECADGSAGCDPHAICANKPGSFSCTCLEGYAGTGTSCHPSSYSWRSGAFGACSNSCGTGAQTRTVDCVSGGAVVADTLCPSPKPDVSQPCTDASSCTASWSSGTYGSCSSTCGTGSQTRTVTCQRSDGTTAPDVSCSGAKPATSQSCTDTSSCTASWSSGTYGSCSSTCGTGTQTRTVTCQRSDGTTAPDVSCSGARPATSQSCTDSSTCTYSWASGTYGSCNNTCGSGSQTRTVTCQRSDGTVAADGSCSGAKPATSLSCTDTSACTYVWSTGAFGSCSTTCGSGTQTRTVGCQRSDGNIVADLSCSGTKPSTSQACSATSGCPLPTCSVSVSPTSGGASTSNTVTWSSDGTSCTWTMDGVNQGPVACSGTSSAPGWGGVGTHTVTLGPTGPGGTTSCSATWAVSPLPTCAISVSPGNGGAASSYTVNWSSDATSCTYLLDGVDKGAVVCSGVSTDTGANYGGAGSHTITLRPTGPGGTTSCQASYTVSPLPSCSVTVSPTSGTSATFFTLGWSSNGSSCTWTYNGAFQGALPSCSGTNSPGTKGYPVGNYNVTLNPTGIGGTSSCQASWTVR